MTQPASEAAQRVQPMPCTFRILKLLLTLLLSCMTLSSCARVSGHEAVSVSAINYTDQELNAYLFLSPDGEKKQIAGGESVRPFEGGGAMCCFSLPAKWRRGIKVRVRYDWWQGDDVPRKYQTIDVEVQPYPDGQVGTLWALFYPDGSVEVVSSNFAPGHAKWPGKVKGWPVPTVEHRRKLWQLDYDEAKLGEQAFSAARDESDAAWDKQWANDQTYGPKFPRSFNGARDPEYREFKRREDQDALKRIRIRLADLEANRP